MKKLAYLTFLFLSCISCVINKSVEYSSEFHIVNNLGHNIEIFMGSSYYATLSDQEDMILFEEHRNPEFCDMHEFVYGLYPQDVTLYNQGTYGHELLKTWRFDERDEPGKQLYRLSDCKREVTTEDVDQSFFTNGRFHTWGCFYVRYCFTFTINPEDI